METKKELTHGALRTFHFQCDTCPNQAAVQVERGDPKPGHALMKPREPYHTGANNRYQSRQQAAYEAMGYPAEVARAQARFDLDALCHRAWVAGGSLYGIGKKLDRTGTMIQTRARRHWQRRNKGTPYPIEQWAQPNLIELKVIYEQHAKDRQRAEDGQAQGP